MSLNVNTVVRQAIHPGHGSRISTGLHGYLQCCHFITQNLATYKYQQDWLAGRGEGVGGGGGGGARKGKWKEGGARR